MNASVILAHPDPNSFNHALSQAVVETLQHHDVTVRFHDLYGEGFEPLLPAPEIERNTSLPERIQVHCREIAEADLIVIVHPNWWGQPPAILKGWVDRIIRPGVAYEFLEEDGGEGVPRGLLQAGTALVFNTSNTETNREIEVFGDPLDTIWRNCIFGLCGVTDVHRKVFNIVVTSTLEQRHQWLAEARQSVEKVIGRIA